MKRRFAGALFVAPAALVYLPLVLVPVVFSIGLSFVAWDGLSNTSWRWVGLGNYAEALSVLGVVEALSVDTRPNSLRLSQMAVTYSQAGRSDEAMRIFNELEERAQEAPIGEAIWARANIAIGDYDQALQHLEAAIRDRVPTDVGTLAELAANVTNDPVLETDPRYRELLGGIWDDG